MVCVQAVVPLNFRAGFVAQFRLSVLPKWCGRLLQARLSGK